MFGMLLRLRLMAKEPFCQLKFAESASSRVALGKPFAEGILDFAVSLWLTTYHPFSYCVLYVSCLVPHDHLPYIIR
jgi:hypothetical protein